MEPIYHVLLAQISLIHSLAICLYNLSLPAGLLDYILCPYRAVADKFYLVSQHLHVCVKEFTGECRLWVRPNFFICLVHLIWAVLEIGGWWPCSCFVGCCFQDSFNIVHSILVEFLSSFFSICLVNVHVVHPYGSINTTAPRLSFKPYFHTHTHTHTHTYIYIYIYRERERDTNRQSIVILYWTERNSLYFAIK